MSSTDQIYHEPPLRDTVINVIGLWHAANYQHFSFLFLKSTLILKTTNQLTLFPFLCNRFKLYRRHIMCMHPLPSVFPLFPSSLFFPLPSVFPFFNAFSCRYIPYCKQYRYRPITTPFVYIFHKSTSSNDDFEISQAIWTFCGPGH